MFYDAVPVEHELIISVSVNTFKTKGILVFAPREYISVLEPKLFIMCKTFSLYATKEQESSPPSLYMSPPISLPNKNPLLLQVYIFDDSSMDAGNLTSKKQL